MSKSWKRLPTWSDPQSWPVRTTTPWGNRAGSDGEKCDTSMGCWKSTERKRNDKTIGACQWIKSTSGFAARFSHAGRTPNNSKWSIINVDANPTSQPINYTKTYQHMMTFNFLPLQREASWECNRSLARTTWHHWTISNLPARSDHTKMMQARTSIAPTCSWIQ